MSNTLSWIFILTYFGKDDPLHITLSNQCASLTLFFIVSREILKSHKLTSASISVLCLSLYLLLSFNEDGFGLLVIRRRNLSFDALRVLGSDVAHKQKSLPPARISLNTHYSLSDESRLLIVLGSYLIALIEELPFSRKY